MIEIKVEECSYCPMRNKSHSWGTAECRVFDEAREITQ